MNTQLWPSLSEGKRLEMLQPPTGRARVVLDTDTFNEVDDQFAVAWAILSPEQIDLEALYAAPFERLEDPSPDGLRTPEDGMLASYDELVRVVARLDDYKGPILQGSTHWLPAADEPVESRAARDLVERALAAPEPLYVLSIGAPTNVASALLMAPEVIERIVVVWLGGNPWYWHQATEYNAYQDLHASRVLLDSGVPLVHIPAVNVTEHLRTCEAEIDRFVDGRGEIGNYLAEIYRDHAPEHFARSKEIWDLGAVAWMVEPAWMPSPLIHSRVITERDSWGWDPSRHFIREALTLDRDAIFGDLFRKLDRHAAAAAAGTTSLTAGVER
jgi:purine nucleosidase